ncbi:MAG: SPOR domain-containing protein [Candidatus Thiothrix putei]|uniref:SPOR domain-containing protein n=1 Tax=Candidatus Thiothrix putei TaxID=3080811 RepID=A0AA95HHW0_9GAMM|nr:MAG: SPOR domain-containing protein [Candidatus Thiothrix putei]
MDNKATTKRMIGAVVLVLVAALLLAWLLKGKNRDGQQDMAMNQSAETKPILGFPGVGGDEQKPTIVGDDPNAATQQTGAGIDVAQQNQNAAGTAQQAGGANLIPGIDVKLPETVPNTTGFEVRPGIGGEVRDLVDTDGKVKDGMGSMGTGNAKANTPETGSKAPVAAQPTAPAETKTSQVTTPSASQKDKPATNTPAPEEKKASSKVVLVNEKPVPRAVSEAGVAQAAAKKAAEEKAAAAKEAAEKAAKLAAEKAAAAKSVALASAGAAAGNAAGGAGSFTIQVLASADKAKADAAAGPLKADGYNVAVSTANVGGKTVYRVNVTGFADRAAAEAAQAKMKSRYKQNSAIQGSFVTSSK